MTRRSKTLTDQENEAYVEMNPEDAEKLGIKQDQNVKVTSRRGAITLRTYITSRIRGGVVFIPFHFKEAPANVLTNNALDVDSKIPEFKVCAVRIDPA
jgi:formate dehydrogenase major subunit